MKWLNSFCDGLNSWEKGIIDGAKPILKERLKRTLLDEAKKVTDEFVVELINKISIRGERTSDGVIRFVFEVKDFPQQAEREP